MAFPFYSVDRRGTELFGFRMIDMAIEFFGMEDAASSGSVTFEARQRTFRQHDDDCVVAESTGSGEDFSRERQQKFAL